MLCYALLVAYWMLFGFGRYVHTDHGVNLIPFTTIIQFFHLAETHSKASAINLLGNIAVFVPFGCLIPIAFGRGFLKMLLIHSVGIVLLETAQYFSRRGILDIDDFILNSIGAMIGYLVWNWWQRSIQGKQKHSGQT